LASYIILSSVVFLTYFSVGTTGPFLALYAQSLGASLAQIAWVTGTYATTALVANIFWGRQMDRIGRRKPFLVGAMAVLTCTSITGAMVPTGHWWFLVPIRGIEGLAAGAYGVGSLAMMGDILANHPRRATMMGAYRMSGSLAFSIAILVAGTVAQRNGFRTIFFATGVTYGMALLTALFLREPQLQATTGRAIPSFRSMLEGPMRPLFVLLLSFWMPMAAVVSIYGPFVADYLGYGRDGYARLWALAAFAEVPCMLLAGWLSDRYSRRLTFTLGLTAFAVVYLLYALATTTGGLVVAQLLRGFAYAAFTATAMTMIVELSPADARGKAASLFLVGQGMSGMLGNYAGGPVAQAFGYRTLFLACTVILMLGAVYAQVQLRVRQVLATPGGGVAGVSAAPAVKS